MNIQMVQAFYNLLLYRRQKVSSFYRCYKHLDNAALLPNKLVNLEDYEGGNEGESMKKRHWR